MSEDTTDDPDDEEDADVAPSADDVQEELAKSRERLQEGAEQAVEGFDEGLVDLLSWLLDTETRARIYVYLRQHPGSTSEEIAEGTGLYPSTVREALAELTDEEKVTREKRESEGAGNNPYEYDAIAPSDLVGGVVTDVQSELNTVFNLDDYLGEAEIDPDSEPVRITVDEEDDEAAAADDADDEEEAADDAADAGDADDEAAADGGDDDDLSVDAVDEVDDDDDGEDDES
jgi:DNA-binding transcriptional ArsR family regulator